MYIVRNNILPFEGYKAVNICGILFIRKDVKLSDIDLNHEEIHTKLIFEMLIIFYYLWYWIEWLIRILFSKDRFTHKAYHNIGFELEAYKNQNNLDYIKTRKHFAWINEI